MIGTMTEAKFDRLMREAQPVDDALWLKLTREFEAEEIVRHHKQLEADKRRSVTTDLDQGWAHKAVYTITRRS